MIVPAIYDEVGSYNQSAAMVKKDGKYFWIGLEGKPVSDKVYDSVEAFDDKGVAKASVGEKWGLVNRAGAELLAVVYDQIGEWDLAGLAKLEQGGKFGWADHAGRVVVRPKYEEVGDFDANGLAKVKIGGKMGFLNVKYREIIPVIYDSVSDFHYGVAKVCADGKWGFIDIDGKAVTPLKYDEVGEIADGIATVKMGNKWGIIDNKYDEILAPIYDEIGEFSNGITWVKLEGKCGLIDKSGRGITAPKYDTISNFEDNLAQVTIGGLYGYINRTGAEIVPVVYTAEEALDLCKEFLYYQSFTNFANEFMAPKIEAFKVKDEFETEAQYALRVNESSIANLKAKLTEEAEAEYVKQRGSSVVLQLTLGSYDAETETFSVTDSTYGTFTVKVPLNIARDFKSLWDGLTKSASFCVKDDVLAVEGLTIRMPDGKEFSSVN